MLNNITNRHSAFCAESLMVYVKKFFLILILFILGACTHKIIKEEAPIVNEIRSGEKFSIILPENHAENYYWKLSEHHDKTIIDYINAAWHGNEKGVYYHFTALKSGTDTLRLTQYKMQDSVKTAVYIITVLE